MAELIKKIVLGAGLVGALVFGKLAYDCYSPNGRENDLCFQTQIMQEVRQETKVIGRSIQEMSSDDLDRLALLVYNKRETPNKEKLLEAIDSIRVHQRRIKGRNYAASLFGGLSLCSLFFGIAGYKSLSKNKS